MNLKRAAIVLTICGLVACSGLAFGDSSPGATQNNLPFPSYGTGTVVVRIYTDYFCPPCRAVEPQLEPLLIDLVKSRKITVTFVDTPIYNDSQVYARHLLYALNKKNDFEHALYVRSILFEAAAGKVDKDALEEYLKGKDILLRRFNVKPVSTRLNGLLQGDNVGGTPSCVIVKDGKFDKRVGGGEILKALKELQ